MSTDKQRYSLDNQIEAIRLYARQRGYDVVQSYADAAKSGLHLKNRAGLMRLLEDVESGTANFDALLVYDVSRFGRFQDTDEAASYELRCRRAGVAVHYCAEVFENDGSLASTILKTLKRAMAAEYSRDLSVKVFTTQASSVRRGFFTGGNPGFGLRRLLIDPSNKPMFTMEAGEQKVVSRYRTKLIPGPRQETGTVRKIFRLFVEDGLNYQEIADALNGRQIANAYGRPWKRSTVRAILTSERYIGNNVWGKTSYKLRLKKVTNRSDIWIRYDGAFRPTIDKDLFRKAHARAEAIFRRQKGFSEEVLLAKLRRLLKQYGSLSGSLLDATIGPGKDSYRKRYKGLLNAFAQVGYVPERDYSYIARWQDTDRLRAEIAARLIDDLNSAGATASFGRSGQSLTIAQSVAASVYVLRCRRTKFNVVTWKTTLRDRATNLAIITRLDAANQGILDYFLIPMSVLRGRTTCLYEHGNVAFAQYRTTDLLASLGPAGVTIGGRLISKILDLVE